jgi:phenylpyruvate C(3)-methyltransferase
VSAIDTVFNDAVSAYAISAAWELGLLTRVETCGGAVDLAGFAREEELDLGSVRAIARVLAYAEVVGLDADEVTSGPLFAEAVLKKGYFYWLTRGCGELFATMPELVRDANRAGDFVRRDYRAIGLAAKDAGARFVDPPFYRLVEDRGLVRGADLGCGSGGRLIELARRDPRFRGVGVDVADGALALAGEAVAAAGLADRLSVVRDDATGLGHRPEYRDVEFVSMFMMGHDLWPRPDCLASLKMLGDAFPAATDLVICDTYRSELAPGEPHPVFTLGFETAHAVMGQEIPTLAEWGEVLDEAGWHMADVIEFELPPYTALMHLTRKPSLD